jgi:hypothetical protein
LPSDRLPPIEGGPSVPQGRNTFSATVEEVSLPKEEERVLGPQSFEDQLRQADQNLRQWMATRIVWTFIAGNVLTLAVLGGLAWLDQNNIEHNLINPEDRVITYQVLMALLGATTVQVGTVAAIIARYLFPGRLRDG